MKIEHGDEETTHRPYKPLRDMKLCLELDCSAVWWDDKLVCPRCGGGEVVLIETYMNRQEKKAPLTMVVPIRARR